jgi:hypothetical protein
MLFLLSERCAAQGSLERSSKDRSREPLARGVQCRLRLGHHRHARDPHVVGGTVAAAATHGPQLVQAHPAGSVDQLADPRLRGHVLDARGRVLLPVETVDEAIDLLPGEGLTDRVATGIGRLLREDRGLGHDVRELRVAARERDLALELASVQETDANADIGVRGGLLRATFLGHCTDPFWVSLPGRADLDRPEKL